MKVDDEFKNICAQILAENKTSGEWSEIESSDMYQTEHYCGGYDADENAFCFSHYDSEGNESWFQVDMKEVVTIVNGSLSNITIRGVN